MASACLSVHRPSRASSGTAAIYASAMISDLLNCGTPGLTDRARDDGWRCSRESRTPIHFFKPNNSFQLQTARTYALSSTNRRRLFVTDTDPRVVGKASRATCPFPEKLIAGRNLAEQIMLLSLNCMECRPNSRSLVVLLVWALAFSCTICPYLNTPGPVVTPLNPGAQIEAMLRPSPPASTVT